MAIGTGVGTGGDPLGLYQVESTWEEHHERETPLTPTLTDNIIPYLKSIVNNPLCTVVVLSGKPLNASKSYTGTGNSPTIIDIGLMYVRFIINVVNNVDFVAIFDTVDPHHAALAGNARDRYTIRCDDPLVLQEIISAGEDPKTVLKWLSVLMDSPCKVIEAVRVTPSAAPEKHWIINEEKTWTTSGTIPYTTTWGSKSASSNSLPYTTTWGSKSASSNSLTYKGSDYTNMIDEPNKSWFAEQYSNISKRIKSIKLI